LIFFFKTKLGTLKNPGKIDFEYHAHETPKTKSVLGHVDHVNAANFCA